MAGGKLSISVCVALLFAWLVQSAAPPSTEKPPKAAAVDDDYLEALKFLAECKKELKLTDDDVAALEKNVWGQNTKCLIKCVAEKFDLFKNNALVEKEALEWIEEEKAENVTLAKIELEMFNTCKKISEKNDCDTAAKMFQCARDIGRKLGA